MDPQTPCLPQSSIPATFLIPRRAKPYLGPQRASYGGPDPTSPALVGGLFTTEAPGKPRPGPGGPWHLPFLCRT